MKKMPITKLTKEAISTFVEGGGTLEQLAERYACDEVRFMSFAKKKLGKGGWKKITHQSNENTRKKLKQEEVIVEVVEEDDISLEEVVEEKEQSDFYYVEETEETLKNRQEELINQFNSILEDIKRSQEVAREANETMEQTKQQIAKAERMIAEANQSIAEAIKDFDYEEKQQSKFTYQLNELSREIEEIERKLAEAQEVILVAPNYHGELPPDGKLISVSKFSERVEVENVAEVQITATVSEMIMSGFETIKEYAEVMRFAELCGEYNNRGKKYKILVDDERVEYILNNLVREE